MNEMVNVCRHYIIEDGAHTKTDRKIKHEKRYIVSITL